MRVAGDLVVGLGHPDRGDDAVGHHVAHEVWRRRPGTDVRTLLEPLRLLDLMSGRRLVVVVDAAASTGPTGVIEVHDTTWEDLPTEPGSGESSRALAVGEVIALARGTGTTPRQLMVVTVSGSRFVLGEPPQPGVLGAVAPATDEVLRLIEGERTGAPVRTGGRDSAPPRRP